MKKRAQMEIFGLVVIVLLLSVIMLIVLGITTNKKPSTVRQSFKESQMVSSFLHTMLRTETPCQKLTIKDLLDDCYSKRKVDCGQTPTPTPVNPSITTPYPGGMPDSCAYAYLSLFSIMDKTFNSDDFKLDYVLKVFVDKEEDNNYLFKNFPGISYNYFATSGPMSFMSTNIIPSNNEGRISRLENNALKKECTSPNVETAFYPFSSSGHTIFVKLDLCSS